MRHMVWTVVIRSLRAGGRMEAGLSAYRIYSKNCYSFPDNNSAFEDIRGSLEDEESIIAIVKGSHEVYSISHFEDDGLQRAVSDLI